MQGMRRFFVPGPSIICAFDDANRQSLPREGVAALPYAELGDRSYIWLRDSTPLCLPIYRYVDV